MYLYASVSLPFGMDISYVKLSSKFLNIKALSFIEYFIEIYNQQFDILCDIIMKRNREDFCQANRSCIGRNNHYPHIHGHHRKLALHLYDKTGYGFVACTSSMIFSCGNTIIKVLSCTVVVTLIFSNLLLNNLLLSINNCLLVCLCFTSLQQRCHLETAPHLLCLAKDVKLAKYTVPTGNRTPGCRVAVHYATAVPRKLHKLKQTSSVNHMRSNWLVV